jgi:hypothetical protein
MLCSWRVKLFSCGMSKFGNKVSIAFNRVEWVTNFGTHFMLPNSLESGMFSNHKLTNFGTHFTLPNSNGKWDVFKSHIKKI